MRNTEIMSSENVLAVFEMYSFSAFGAFLISLGSAIKTFTTIHSELIY